MNRTEFLGKSFMRSSPTLIENTFAHPLDLSGAPVKDMVGDGSGAMKICLSWRSIWDLGVFWCILEVELQKSG